MNYIQIEFCSAEIMLENCEQTPEALTLAKSNIKETLNKVTQIQSVSIVEEYRMAAKDVSLE